MRETAPVHQGLVGQGAERLHRKQRDLSDYIGYRLAQSPAIQTNVTASVNGKAESSCSANQTRFASHLLALARGSFLFAKLTLDLIESGHLVAKSASYKVSETSYLPVNLAFTDR